MHRSSNQLEVLSVICDSVAFVSMAVVECYRSENAHCMSIFIWLVNIVSTVYRGLRVLATLYYCVDDGVLTLCTSFHVCVMVMQYGSSEKVTMEMHLDCTTLLQSSNWYATDCH